MSHKKWYKNKKKYLNQNYKIIFFFVFKTYFFSYIPAFKINLENKFYLYLLNIILYKPAADEDEVLPEIEVLLDEVLPLSQEFTLLGWLWRKWGTTSPVVMQMFVARYIFLNE